MIPGASFGFRVIVLEETGLLQRLVNQLSINNKNNQTILGILTETMYLC
jgi:hypothetical protein